MVQDEGDRKPGSVPPILQAAMIIHLGQALPTASSDRTRRLSGEQPVSHLIPPRCRGGLKTGLPPYLVLLRVGFAESRCHHRDWCALTAPFHPYQARCTAGVRSMHGPGGLFSVALSLGSPPLDVIQHPALAEPGLSSPHLAVRSDHLVSFILKRWASASVHSLSKAVGPKRFDVSMPGGRTAMGRRS